MIHIPDPDETNVHEPDFNGGQVEILEYRSFDIDGSELEDTFAGLVGTLRVGERLAFYATNGSYFEVNDITIVQTVSETSTESEFATLTIEFKPNDHDPKVSILSCRSYPGHIQELAEEASGRIGVKFTQQRSGQAARGARGAGCLILFLAPVAFIVGFGLCVVPSSHDRTAESGSREVITPAPTPAVRIP